MKKSYKGFPIYALIIIGVLIATQLFSSSFSSQRGQKIEAAKLFEYIDSGVIDAVALESSTAYAHMKASSIPLSAFSNAAYDFSAVISRDTFVETCRQLAARKAGKPLEDITEIDLGFDLIYLPQPATPWLLDMLPYIIMTVGLMAFWLMMMRQQGGGGGKMMTFGHSPARVFEPDGNRITFADVAGAVEEKEEMQELVEFLKNPRRFTSVGARIPKGVLLVGPPGTGKTLLARALKGILPPLSDAEMMEVMLLRSTAGLNLELSRERPFRSVHHTASAVSICGGGSALRPGEISLASRGVLFLDEFPEFQRDVIEALRQPLEDGSITVSRAAGSVVYPAKVLVVAACNPCPCGFAGDAERQCICTPFSLERYRRKLSGPILDRIDLHVAVPRLTPEELVSLGGSCGERSETVRAS